MRESCVSLSGFHLYLYFLFLYLFCMFFVVQGERSRSYVFEFLVILIFLLRVSRPASDEGELGFSQRVLFVLKSDAVRQE